MTTTFEPTNESALFIDCTAFSPAWQKQLEQSAPYMPTDSRFPSLVVPIPDREDCLILSENECFYSPQQTFATLRTHEQIFEAFSYVLWSRTIRHFNFAGSKLLPIANRTSCLFPVATAIQHALWINPMKIHDVKSSDHLTRLIMTDGTVVRTTVSRRTLNVRATYALLALATIRRDYLYTDIFGERPLDYVALPNTPFARALSRQPKLHQFTVPVHAFKQQYERQQLIQEVINLGRRSQIQGLTYQSLSQLLNN